MNNARYLLIVAGVSAGVLGGCNIFVDRDPFGAHPLIAQDELEDIDLARVLSAGEFTMDASKSEPRKREELELAFADFNRQLDRMPVAADRRLARNRVQERILAGSNQACGDYKHELKQLDAEVNFFLGSLTTGLAGAGAIFTGADIVRALSGAAGITSGIRSEFNEDFFQSLTIQVITDGLESKRREIYEEMLEARQADLETYPIERAIKDAVFYHDNCSLIAGLEQAAVSIERNENPGVDAMNRVLKKMGETRSAVDVLAGTPAGGAAAASRDLSRLYDSLDSASQMRQALQSDADTRLELPAGRDADSAAQTALANADAQIKAAVAAFDKAYGDKLRATSQIAETIRTLTAAATDEAAGADARSVGTAELAVEQAKIRVLVNGLQDAERTLAGAVNGALDHLETAIAPAQPPAAGGAKADPAKTTAD